MKLDAGETCCVCYEEMKDVGTENLTYCKFGCGRNLHVDCIEVWVKHKLSVAQKITCPVSFIMIMSVAVQMRLGSECSRGIEGGDKTVQGEED